MSLTKDGKSTISVDFSRCLYPFRLGLTGSSRVLRGTLLEKKLELNQFSP